MHTIEETVEHIVAATGWNQRIAQIRLIPQHHGTGEHVGIYATVARRLYLEHLAPDYAYIHEAPFYEQEHFLAAYEAASAATAGFTKVSEDDVARALVETPRSLLVFRTILGLTKEEFAHSTVLAGGPFGLNPLTSGKVDAMERHGTTTSQEQGRVAARTVLAAIDGSLFGDPPTGLKSKQAKADTARGWDSVRAFAVGGVPFGLFLHQRHYGGAFRQVLDATSTRRGDLIEDAVEALFRQHRCPYIRTGAHNQEEIARRLDRKSVV